ncbi:endothelial cell adhesion molecule a isoform X2 [Sphaeramia orbicularis]|uniref:endothelial cell adhesion molecule a isoform X2 n=1 Tax=Sphaeramia orbicularis TaxID=375764 RepID=UPI00117DE03C|nr:endothelial cell-selective adhesion molecule-like isoform X2 [Sphaeramia orbicularis]
MDILYTLAGIGAQIQMPLTKMDVIKGQKAVLVATYSTTPGTDPSTNTILWNFVSNSTQLIISYTKGSIIVGNSPQFKNRVGFTEQNPLNNISLYINNTQESDSGRYLCQVISPTSPGLTAELSLDVKVPPAVPKCSQSGKPVVKGNVTLSCTSGTGKPIPMYKWKKTSPTSEVFFSPTLDEKTGTLKLTNLSSNMSGKYVCTASNSAGSESCFINLEIVSSTNVGMIVGATVGSVVGFLALVAFICLFFVLKRRQDNEDDMANEIKEDAQAPKRVSWAKSGMGSDIISKNGTLSSIASSPHHKEPSHHHNNHHHHLQQYPQRPPSDTASIITATGSTAGYRPSRQQGASTPTHYSYNNNSTLPRGQPFSSDASTSGSSLPRPERYTQLPQAQAPPQTYSQPQAQHQPVPSPPPLPTSALTASNITRMGGVPIMVPAQNQAGSLV